MFNFKSFKQKLANKGISVIASSNEVVAGLIWGVEGIEKVPKLGDVLFYIVNGTRYGVKPKRGNKHDIEWYYKQLKMGMQGAKAYHTGLTQFLNTWIKKGELEVVFKGKATASVDGEVATASPQLIGETAIDNIILHELNLNADKKSSGFEDVSWFIRKNGNKTATIKYKDGIATIYDGNNNAVSKEIKTVQDFKDKITKLITQEVIGSTAINESVIDNILLQEMNLNADKKNEGDFTVWTLKAGNRNLANIKLNKITGLVRIETIYGKVLAHTITTDKDFRDTLHKLMVEKVIAKVEEASKIDSVSKTAILNYLWDKLIDFETDNEKDNKITFNIVDSDNKIVLDISNQVAKVYIDNKEHIVKTMRELNNLFKVNKIAAAVEDRDSIIKEFIDKVNNLKVRGMSAFNAFKHSNGITIQLLLPRFNTEDMDKLSSVVEDKLNIIFPITQKWMDADKGRTFGNLAKVGDIALYTDEWSSQEFSSELNLDFKDSKFDESDIKNELDALYEQLESDCKELNNPILKFNIVTAQVTADVAEHDRLLYYKVSFKDFVTMWKTSTQFNPTQLNRIVLGFKLANRAIEKLSDVDVGYFYKRKDGKGYIRLEYKNDLYIIYASRSEENGDIKVVTRKMRKKIPTKNFNLLSTSVSSLAYENATLPAGIKKVWEEVTKD